MKRLKIAFFLILFLIISFIGIKAYRNFTISKELKNKEKIRFNNTAKVLNKCFDLEQKSQRSLNESMKLIEYCLKKYGP